MCQKTLGLGRPPTAVSRALSSNPEALAPGCEPHFSLSSPRDSAFLPNGSPTACGAGESPHPGPMRTPCALRPAAQTASGLPVLPFCSRCEQLVQYRLPLKSELCGTLSPHGFQYRSRCQDLSLSVGCALKRRSEHVSSGCRSPSAASSDSDVLPGPLLPA